MPTLQIVTGDDARFLDSLRGAVGSAHAHTNRRTRLGVFGLDLTFGPRAWVEGQASAVVTPDWHHTFAGRDHAPRLTARVTRPTIPP